MPFTDDDLKRLKSHIGGWHLDNGTLSALFARLEAAEDLAYSLESICDIDCPDCGKELDDPHEADCDIGKELENWHIALGESIEDKDKSLKMKDLLDGWLNTVYSKPSTIHYVCPCGKSSPHGAGEDCGGEK